MKECRQIILESVTLPSKTYMGIKIYLRHIAVSFLIFQLSNGIVNTGSSDFIVSDELSSHRSHTTTGVKLLIIDGTFLKHL